MSSKITYSKLEQLADAYGYDDMDDFLAVYVFDSVVPGICTNPDCDFTAEYEPDQREGWCEECSTHTVQSALVLAGLN